MTSHNKSQLREYRVWTRARQNCYDKNYPAYKKYGGSGITMCEEWLSFIKFYEDMGKIPDDCNALILTDPKASYCKANCVWGISKRGKKDKPASSRSKNKSKKSTCICLTLYTDHYEWIKKQALQKSISENKFIEPNEMIREALYRAFPAPTQVDMFGGKL